ncbi:MAG: hypothetical protein KDH09_17520 [Chrysiogenetes bacterium]|nr:hypothetical protein [Chrysiogenetes bacterium]
MSKVAILVNPNAARNARRADLQKHLEERFGTKVEFILTKDLDALAAEVGRIHERSLDLLAIYGGDGSFRHFYETWFNTLGEDAVPPPVLPVAGGSQNYMARDTGTYLGRSGTKKLNARLGTGEFGEHLYTWHQRNILRVEDPQAAATQYAFVYTDGLFWRVGKRYYEMGATQWAAAKALFGTLAAGFASNPESFGGVMAPDPSEVVLDDDARFGGHLAMLLSTLNTLLLNLRLFPEPDVTGEGFHLFALSREQLRQNIVRFLQIGWKGGQGHHWHEPGIRTGVHNQVEVKGTPGYALEGEIITPAGGPTDLTITLGPKVRLARMV